MPLRKILVESRVEDVLNKHFKGTPGGYLEKIYYDEIVPGSAEINPNHKYLEWIAKNWDTSGPNEDGDVDNNLKEILLAVSKFDNESQRLEIKDLNQYRDIDQLFDALKKVGETARRTVDITDDVEKIYEDNRFVVVSPKTHTASCYYGAGTKWCTATKDSDSHFSTYKGNGELYYIIDKTLPTSNPYYKVALNKKIAGHTEDFWDVKDSPITDTNNILPIMQNSKMIKEIRNHFAIKFEERIQEEADLQSQRLSQTEERRERERLRRIQMQREADERKENDEWNPDATGTQGLLANALKEWLLDNDEWDGATKYEIRSQIEELRSEMENDPEVIEDPNGEKAQEYGEDLDNLQDDYGNAESVYDIYPLYDYYGMHEFEYGGAEYAVGDDDAADEAATERTRSLIEDIGYEGFNPGFMEDHIDGDAVADYMYDWFWDDVNDAPEDWLEDDDREISKEAEDRLDDIDEDIGELQEQLEEVESESEEEEIVARIDELESYKEEISEDDDNWEYTENAKESVVESRMDDVRDDPMSFIRDWGMEDRVEDFINEDEFIEEVIMSDGRGHTLSSYDGDEGEITFDGEWYYIYRTN